MTYFNTCKRKNKSKASSPSLIHNLVLSCPFFTSVFMSYSKLVLSSSLSFILNSLSLSLCFISSQDVREQNLQVPRMFFTYVQILRKPSFQETLFNHFFTPCICCTCDQCTVNMQLRNILNMLHKLFSNCSLRQFIYSDIATHLRKQSNRPYIRVFPDQVFRRRGTPLLRLSYRKFKYRQGNRQQWYLVTSSELSLDILNSSVLLCLGFLLNHKEIDRETWRHGDISDICLQLSVLSYRGNNAMKLS